MIYKLFLYGQKELFAYTEIFHDMNLKEGDMFYFEEKRYKVLRIIRTYKRVEWDDKGNPKRPVQNATVTIYLDVPNLLLIFD